MRQRRRGMPAPDRVHGHAADPHRVVHERKHHGARGVLGARAMALGRRAAFGRGLTGPVIRCRGGVGGHAVAWFVAGRPVGVARFGAGVLRRRRQRRAGVLKPQLSRRCGRADPVEDQHEGQQQAQQEVDAWHRGLL